MNKKFLLMTFSLAVSVLMLACNSRETADNGESDPDSIFVSDDGNTGRMEIELSENEIPVSGTASFQVRVTDVNGEPVNNVRISCDTENDLRIIEPSSGSFFTGSFGGASGVIGCEDTGSFLFACALANGAGIRKSVLVKCEGSRPVGFAGFPGSFGGGLGNGVSDVDDGDDDNDSEFTVRLTDVTFVEAGSSGASVDLSQISDCDGDITTSDPEPFSDTTVRFTISNNSEQIVRFTSYQYTVNNFNGSGGVLDSGRLNLIGEAVGKGGTGTFSGLFADVSGGSKYFFRAPPVLISSTGFKNVEFTLFGLLSDGSQVTVTASQAASFDAFNNC